MFYAYNLILLVNTMWVVITMWMGIVLQSSVFQIIGCIIWFLNWFLKLWIVTLIIVLSYLKFNHFCFCFFLQVSEADKNYKQFMIVKPSLTDDQCHPEEGIYSLVTEDIWRTHMMDDGVIEDDFQIRKVSWISKHIVNDTLICQRSR